MPKSEEQETADFDLLWSVQGMTGNMAHGSPSDPHRQVIIRECSLETIH